MSEMSDRVGYEMTRYQLEASTDGTFFIQDGYTGAIMRQGLTSADEPLDIVCDMNAKSAIYAMREPTDEMYDSLSATGILWKENTSKGVWKAMIDGALK